MKCAHCDSALHPQFDLDEKYTLIAYCPYCGTPVKAKIDEAADKLQASPIPNNIIIDTDGCVTLDVYRLGADRIWRKAHTIDLSQDGEAIHDWPFIIKVVVRDNTDSERLKKVEFINTDNNYP